MKDTLLLQSPSNRTSFVGNRTRMMDTRNRVMVVCRFRPQIQYEMEKGGAMGVQFIDDQTVVMQSKRDSPFSFDKVLSCPTTQRQVFEVVGKPLVEDVLKGYNATIFAYGQTSAGKTFTMMNLPKKGQQISVDQRGLAPRIIDELFDSIDRSADDLEFTVKVSFFEIYMERVYDLLDPLKVNLQVKEEKGGRGFFVSDLTEVYVASDAEVYNILKLGNKNKKISSTKMNSDSSRSHTLLSMTITQKNIHTSQTISSKFYIVDLAGSEKVYKTAASGLRLEEAKSINQSLATLGKVINALTEKNSGHVPYRESKLTKLLQDSLGGNSRTTLLINCSPSTWNEEETISTLRFGLSAKCIKNKPKVNLEISVEEVRRKLKESLMRIQELETHNAALEAALLKRETGDRNNSIQSDDHSLWLDELSTSKNEDQTPESLSGRERNIIAKLKQQVAMLSDTNEQLKQNLSEIKAHEDDYSDSPLSNLVDLDKKSKGASRLEQILSRNHVGKDDDSKVILDIGRVILQGMEQLRIEKDKIRTEHMQFRKMQKEYIEKLSMYCLKLGSSEKKRDEEEKNENTHSSDDVNNISADSDQVQELREYISLLETENRALREDLDGYRRMMKDDSFHMRRFTEYKSPVSSPRGSHNLSTCSNRSQKLIVPLKAGFKKIKQSLVNDSEMEDYDEDYLEDDGNCAEVILKCGNVQILHYEMQGAEKKYIWKKRWLVLPNMSSTIKCYKQLKSLKPYEIPITSCTIQENSVIKGDWDQSAICLSIITQDNKTFVVKVHSEEERQEWILYLKASIKRLQKRASISRESDEQ